MKVKQKARRKTITINRDVKLQVEIDDGVLTLSGFPDRSEYIRRIPAGATEKQVIEQMLNEAMLFK